MNSDTLRIFSIFHSISGEISCWPQGIPVIFIRLAGCNLRCTYCDTADSLPASSGKDMTYDEIVNELRSWGCDRIIITGGEPLMQQEALLPLLEILRKQGYQVVIETNGSITFREFADAADYWVVDVKMPGSAMFDSMMKPIDYIVPNVQLKFVCVDENDVRFAKRYCEEIAKLGTLNFPAFSAAGDLSPSALWETMQRLGVLNAILNLQIHKYIWPGASEER